ncbi:MAG: ABC transporter ATP-binding protein [Spirochaetia bacterium]
MKEQTFTNNKAQKIVKGLLPFIGKYKVHLIALSVVMIIVGLIDAVFPVLTKIAIDEFIVPGNMEGIWLFAIAYVGVVIVQALSIWLLITIAGKIEMGICYDMRKQGFAHLQELSFSFYDTNSVGWIMARLTSDVQKLGETISWGLVDVVWGGTMMSAVAAAMIIMDIRLALFTLSVVPLLAIVSVYFQKQILAEYRQVRKVNSLIAGAFNEGISGARTTKTLVTEEANLRDFQVLSSGMRSSSVRAAVFSAVYLPAVLIIGSIGTAIALWAGGEGVIAFGITYGTLVAFLSYTVQFFEPVRELARVMAEMQSARAAAERILRLLDTSPDVKDTSEAVAIYGSTFQPKKEKWPQISGSITFENVGFAYKTGEIVLEDFSIHIPAGQSVALVGETGSGKSTIVNLACRFYEPTSGRVLIDGRDYRELPQIWHQQHLGYVLQSPHLFSGTIMDNIRYGNLAASEEQVIEAAKMLGADDIIRALPEGYRTGVGESGDMLSAGEKQLISFARAVLADPDIFVLDEATSSIDTETEQMIQKAVEKLLRNRTSFIIAHRLSTIRRADRILVIQNGKVIEDGSHDELVNNNGVYANLYNKQFSLV